MRRILLLVLGAGLVLAPAAAAGRPEAIFTAPREPVEPGKPWQVTVELDAFARPPKPAMTGRLGARTVGGQVERAPSSIEGASAFRITMIFPRRGRWALRLYADGRRFAFPPVDVGSPDVPQDYLAFAGGGGKRMTDDQPAPAPSPAARPKVARSEPREDAGDAGAWILPLLGVMLAGAGVAAFTRRGSR